MAALKAALKDEEDEEQQGLFSTGEGPVESPPKAEHPDFVLDIFYK